MCKHTETDGKDCETCENDGYSGPPKGCGCGCGYGGSE